MERRLSISQPVLSEFCRRWMVAELAVFGSVLREDFGPASDIDILVRFEPEARWSLLDVAEMQAELEGLLGRDVDLVEEGTLRNPFRRHAILSTKKVLYAA